MRCLDHSISLKEDGSRSSQAYVLRLHETNTMSECLFALSRKIVPSFPGKSINIHLPHRHGFRTGTLE
jgi:hypothetical protein